MIEINLIPDVKLELLKARRQRRNVISISVVVAVAATALVILMTFYTFAVQTIAGTLADNAIKQESKKLQQVEDLSKTLTIQKQLSLLSSQHNDKNVSSRIFDIITTVVPAGDNTVAISRLAVDTDDKLITIEGEAKNGYEALEVFKKTIEQTKFAYVVDNETREPVSIAQSISDGERRYGEDSEGKRVLRFTLSFKYPAELFSATASKGEIVAPQKKNATDSVNGVPKSLFTNLPDEEKL